MLVSKIILYQDDEFTFHNNAKNIQPDKVLGGLTHNSKHHKNPLDYTRGLGKKETSQKPTRLCSGALSQNNTITTQNIQKPIQISTRILQARRLPEQ